jgi:hypothetical protein
MLSVTAASCSRADDSQAVFMLEDHENQFAHFAARNALLVTRRRVKWLAEVQGGLEAFAVDRP